MTKMTVKELKGILDMLADDDYTVDIFNPINESSIEIDYISVGTKPKQVQLIMQLKEDEE